MNPLDRLTQVLTQMVEAHQELLQFAKEKKEILISGSIHELASIIPKESESIKTITKLDEQRNQAIQAYLGERGLVSEPLPLSELIKLINDEEARQGLLQFGKELGEAVGELQELNEFNQQLLEQSLAYINHSMELMTETPEQDVTYGNRSSSRKKTSGNQQRFFDTRA